MIANLLLTSAAFSLALAGLGFASKSRALIVGAIAGFASVFVTSMFWLWLRFQFNVVSMGFFVPALEELVRTVVYSLLLAPVASRIRASDALWFGLSFGVIDASVRIVAAAAAIVDSNIPRLPSALISVVSPVLLHTFLGLLFVWAARRRGIVTGGLAAFAVHALYNSYAIITIPNQTFQSYVTESMVHFIFMIAGIVILWQVLSRDQWTDVRKAATTGES